MFVSASIQTESELIGIGTAEFKKVLKEGDMLDAVGTCNTPVRSQTPESSWVRITFTLDPEHYRTLWERAENEHRPIASLVRESVLAALDAVPITSRENKTHSKEFPQSRS